MPKISVILPVYNSSLYLRQCLDSIKNQTFSDIEVICIDDCSKDDSYAILQEYAQNDKRFKILRNRINHGTGYTRNKGLKIAKGKFILIVDADDWLEPELCELCINKITEKKCTFVIFGYNKYFEETGEYKYVKKMLKPFLKERKQLESPKKSKFILDDMTNNFIVSSFIWAIFVRHKFLLDNKIKYLNLRNFEDHSFFSDICLNAKSVYIINKPLCNHRVYGESTTYRITHQVKNIYEAKKYIFNKLKKTPTSEIKKISTYVYTIKSCLFWFEKYKEMCPEIEIKFYKTIQKIFKMFEPDYVESKVKPFLSEEDYAEYYRILTTNPYQDKEANLALIIKIAALSVTIITMLILVGIKIF